ncbi:MAG: FtsX-like permease family protein, partial [Acidobacteria bacterium]|nr:FtsX-like permease family protein [Acidobacteriota bacterium]
MSPRPAIPRPFKARPLMDLFRTFILRRLRQEKLRALATVLGVALGIAVVLAVRMANQSSVRSFETALEMVAGKTSLEIVGSGQGLREERLLELGWLEQFGQISPVIEGEARASFPSGEREWLKILGVDILRDETLRDYRLVRLADRQQSPTPREFLELLSDPGAIVLTQKLARRYGLDPGTGLDLDIGDRRETLTVRGLLLDRGPARALNGTFALMDIAAAQWFFGRLGRIDRVDLRLKPEISIDRAEAAIAARLPEGLGVQRPSRRGRQVEKMLESFHFNLTALSHIALLVGLFLIYNTVSLSVITRRREVGILRAVGVSRRQVAGLFLAEAGLLAAMGCALGILLGGWLARGALTLTGSTLDRLYIRSAAEPVSLGPEHLVLAFAVGIPLALLAALVPALEASRVPPTEAVRDADRVESRFRLSWRQRWLPAILSALAVGFACLDSVDGLPLFGYAACLSIVFAVAFLVPVVLHVSGRVGSRLTRRWTGVEALLANANLSGSIPRISISVAALAVSLSMVTAITIMIGSFRETVQYWVEQTLRADLFVAPATRSNVYSESTLSPELVRLISTSSRVAAVDPFTSFNIDYQGRRVLLGSGDFEVHLSHSGLLFKAPRQGESAMRAAIGEDAAVVSESFALRHRKAVGDLLVLTTDQGQRAFRVAAVYYDYSSDQGVVVLDRSTFRKYYGDRPPRSLAVYLKEGLDPERARSEMLAGLPPESRLFVHTNASLKTEVLRIFDNTFTITYALEVIAVAVAILGVATTLVTLILDRKPELALLRWAGAEQRQIRKMVVIEAALLGAVS